MALALVLLGVGVGIGFTFATRKPTQVIEFSAAIPGSYYDFQQCLPPTASELAQYNIAVQTLETLNGEPNWLEVGAEKYLGYGVYRNDATGRGPVCNPDEVYDRVAKLASQHWSTKKGQLAEYQLLLAARLRDPPPNVVKAVGESAFSTSPQISGTLKDQDIRPLARSVLASFHEKAAAYSNIAFEQMSADSSMGTAAAQIAASTGHPLALGRIETLMTDALFALPKGGIVPRETKRRLYELSYAFALVGEEGKKHIGPLKQLMKMRVQSWAPPFGMIDSPPKRLCNILAQIAGKDDRELQEFPYCSDQTVPFDE
ncbi:hypothetical protein [Phyllobacterium myrsinacearum]|uniref:hypothetical protein n=1 Tax=Phyllobacterium myrsinacearum TaxID=28101 RepID=UPI001028C83D|nr:hypothetical protein [Phyllobacterium myrsinacearum]